MSSSEQEYWIRLKINAPWNDGGNGLFAIRNIEKGNLVYTEFPETIINHLNARFKANGHNGIDLLYFFQSSMTREQYSHQLKYKLHGKNAADIVIKNEGGPVCDWASEVEILNVKPTWVNHSCMPNMHRIDSNDLITGRLKCQFFALKDITEGEELTISYEDIVGWACVSARRAFLGKEYGFFCRCPRCAEESELRDMEPLRPAHMNVSLQMHGDYRRAGRDRDYRAISRPVKTRPAKHRSPEKSRNLTPSEHGHPLEHSKTLSRSLRRARLKLRFFVEDLKIILGRRNVIENPVAPHNSLAVLVSGEGRHTDSQTHLTLPHRYYTREENNTV